MSYSKQKLLRFKESILKDVNSKILKMKETVLNFEQKELETAKNKKLQETFISMQAKIKNLKLESKQKIAKKELEIKNEILMFRNELMAKIKKGCVEKLLEFTTTVDYEHYLTQNLSQFNNKFNLTAATLLLKPADLIFKEKILKLVNFDSIEADVKNEIGGFKLILNDKKTLIDETLANKFEIEFKKFRKNCKLALNISEVR